MRRVWGHRTENTSAKAWNHVEVIVPWSTLLVDEFRGIPDLGLRCAGGTDGVVGGDTESKSTYSWSVLSTSSSVGTVTPRYLSRTARKETKVGKEGRRTERDGSSGSERMMHVQQL